MRSKLQSSLEAQANQYAKSILMPLCQVRTAINSPGPIDDASISHLAARFDVPVSAMLAKLKQASPAGFRYRWQPSLENEKPPMTG